MRLIDADLLIERMGFYNTSQEREENVGQIITLEDFDNMPTAYDIDKVVEELESFAKLAEDRWVNGTSEHAYQEHKCWVKAIEIVNQGGASDDFCEWKYNDTEYCWESSCDHFHIFMSDGPKENEYGFCPYCGKKIKVVE